MKKMESLPIINYRNEAFSEFKILKILFWTLLILHNCLQKTCTCYSYISLSSRVAVAQISIASGSVGPGFKPQRLFDHGLPKK